MRRPLKTKVGTRVVVAGAVLLVLAAAGILLALRPPPSPARALAVSFTTIDGRRIDLEAQRGKVVLVLFWATSCAICVAEMPDLARAYHHYQPRGFELIAVAMPYDPAAQVSTYAARQALPFPVVVDASGALTAAFGGVQVVPTSFLIDPRGTLRSRTLGAINLEKLQRFLDETLGR